MSIKGKVLASLLAAVMMIIVFAAAPAVIREEINERNGVTEDRECINHVKKGFQKSQVAVDFCYGEAEESFRELLSEAKLKAKEEISEEDGFIMWLSNGFKR